MKHLLSLTATLTLALLTAACDSTGTPAASRSDKAQAELAAYFGTGSSGNTGGFTGTSSNASAAATIAPPMQNDPTMDFADPCAQNLDELVSALLFYYGQHNVLPPTLEDIPRTSPTGAHISISCPDTGKRYVYNAKGLRAPMEFAYKRADGSYQEGSRLVLYDATPAHLVGQRGQENAPKHAVRLGIVMEMSQPTPAIPNPSMQMYIVPIEQGTLDFYLRTAQGNNVVIPIHPQNP